MSLDSAMTFKDISRFDYKGYIKNTVLRNIGYEVIKWMGITPDGKKYTGVEVETPVYPGVGRDNVGNTEISKLKLKLANELPKKDAYPFYQSIWAIS